MKEYNLIFWQFFNIKWSALNNSAVHNQIAFQKRQNINNIISVSVPEIGSKCIFNKKQYSIEDVIYDFDTAGLYKNVYLQCQSDNHYVGYYDYLKAFSHIVDNWKGKDDPTYDSRKWNLILPETFEGWMEDLKILEDYQMLSTEEKIYLSSKRCILSE